MSAELPDIEGAREKKSELEQRIERQVISENGSQLDIPTVQAAEAVIEEPNIKPVESTEKVIEKAVQVTKKRLSAKQLAQLENAREMKRLKKERENMTGRALAQGNETPDLLVEYRRSMETMQTELKAEIQALKDLIKVHPYEAPLQAQMEVKPNRFIEQEVPTYTQDIRKHPLYQEITKTGYVPAERSIPRSREDIRDEKEFKNKWRDVMNNIQFSNEGTEKRAIANPTEMGLMTNRKPDVIYW